MFLSDVREVDFSVVFLGNAFAQLFWHIDRLHKSKDI